VQGGTEGSWPQTALRATRNERDESEASALSYPAVYHNYHHPAFLSRLVLYNRGASRIRKQGADVFHGPAVVPTGPPCAGVGLGFRASK